MPSDRTTLIPKDFMYDPLLVASKIHQDNNNYTYKNARFGKDHLYGVKEPELELPILSRRYQTKFEESEIHPTEFFKVQKQALRAGNPAPDQFYKSKHCYQDGRQDYMQRNLDLTIPEVRRLPVINQSSCSILYPNSTVDQSQHIQNQRASELQKQNQFSNNTMQHVQSQLFDKNYN